MSEPSENDLILENRIKTAELTNSSREFLKLAGDWASFDMRDESGEFVANAPRPSTCGHLIGKAKLVQHAVKGHYKISGHQSCSSVWVCPHCSSKISESRKNSVEQLIDKHIRDFGNPEDNQRDSINNAGIFMATLTLPHTLNMPLVDVLKVLQKAKKLFKQRGFYKQLKRNFLVGSLDALEITYGQNGWHPHYHILLLMNTQTKLPNSKINLVSAAHKKALFLSWQMCVSDASNGMFKINKFGTDIRDGIFAAGYVSKWGLQHELTKGHIAKQGKKGSITPFQMLDPKYKGKYKALYREYYLATKGKIQLRASKGLWDLYGIDYNSDKEIIEELDAVDVDSYNEIMTISHKAYYKMLATAKIPVFLAHCEKNNTREDILRFLDDFN